MQYCPNSKDYHGHTLCVHTLPPMVYPTLILHRKIRCGADSQMGVPDNSLQFLNTRQKNRVNRPAETVQRTKPRSQCDTSTC